MKTEKLGTGITINAEKVIPFGLLMAFAFFKSAAILMLSTKSTAVFLEAYQGDFIPLSMAADALLISVSCLLMLYWKNRGEHAPAYVMTIAGLVTLGLYFMSVKTELFFLPLSLMAWQDAFRVIMEICFWIIAYRFGISHQKTSVLLWMSFPQIFGALCGALFVRLTVALGNTSLLLPMAALLTFCGALCVGILADNGSVPYDKFLYFSKNAIGHQGEAKRHFYLKYAFFATAAILFFATGAFDYYFLRSTYEKFGQNKNDIITLFANIYALIALAWALCIGFARFRKGSFLKPAFLLLIPIALLCSAAVPSVAPFGMLVCAKILDDTAFLHYKEPIFQTMTHIISERVSFRMNILRKIIIEPVALLLCALFLTYLEKSNASADMPLILAALGIISLLALWQLRFLYIKNAVITFGKRLWRGGTLMLFGERLKNLLEKDMCSENAEDAIYALRILENAQYFSFVEKLEEALSHPRKLVRDFALEKIEQLHFTPAIAAVRACLQQDASRRVRCRAVRVLCLLGGTAEEENALTLLTHPDLRAGALTGLMAKKSAGMFAAIAVLNDLSVSANPEDRALVAEVIGEVGNPDFYRPLLPLLNDPDLTVRATALLAAGKLRHTSLLSAVLSAFYIPYLRETATQTLIAFGENAFPDIEYALKTPHTPIQFKDLLIKTVLLTNADSAPDFLFDCLSIHDRRIRFTILRLLNHLDFKVTGRKANEVRLLLYDEIEWATMLLSAANILNKTDVDDSARSALKNVRNAFSIEYNYTLERILLLHGLLHPNTELRYLLFAPDLTKEKEKLARLAYLNKELNGEMKMLCLPLFSDETVERRLNLLRPHFRPPVLPFKALLLHLLSLPEGDCSEWLKASIVYLIGYLKDPAYSDILTTLTHDADPITRETAIWALGRVLTNDHILNTLPQCIYDPFPPAQRMAQFLLDRAKKVIV